MRSVASPTVSRVRALLAVLAVAALSALTLWNGTPAAQAADTTWTVFHMHHTGKIYGTATGASRTEFNTGLMSLKNSEGETIDSLYCIDINTPTEIGVGGYNERPWSTSKINNLAKVQWILNNSYPNLSLGAVEEAAGIAKLSEQEAVEATQAAIWHFTDGFELGKRNGANVSALYTYLVSHAGTTAPEPTTGVTIAQGDYKAGEKVGPITVTTSDNSDAKVTLSQDVKLTYENDTPVDLSKVKSGAKMYFTAPAEAGSLTLKAEGNFKIPAGRVFVSTGHQTLIVASPGDVVKTSEASVSWTAAPAPSTTAPETTSPETTAPETTSPETTAPETTSPETTSTHSIPATGTASTSTSTTDTPTETTTSEVPTVPATSTTPGGGDVIIPPIAQTGANVLGAAAAALLLIGAGAAFIAIRRRSATR